MSAKIDFTKYSSIEIYQMRLDGIIGRTPMRFWDISTAIEVSKYLFEEILKWSIEDIKSGLSGELLNKYKLGGLINLLFSGSPYLLINTVYPNMIKPWELQVAPSGYWNLKTASEAIKWMIEDKLNLSDEEILNNLSLEIFTQYKLSGMMQIFFRSSTIKAIECAYPGRFKPWDFKIVPQGYWIDKENVKQCVIWLIKEKFRWSDEEVIEKYTQQILYDLGLSGVLNYYSILETLILAYPDKDWSRKKHEKYARVGGIVNHKLNRSRYFSEYTKLKKG